MGWSGGTEIFDRTVKAVLMSSSGDKGKYKIIYELADSLMDEDWDTVDESEYVDDRLVRAVLKELKWLDDEE